MPLFAEEASPLYAPSKNEVAQRWQKKVGEFDAFIFTAAEYNRDRPRPDARCDDIGGCVFCLQRL